MEHDTTSSRTQQKYNQVWDMVYAIRPTSENEKIWYSSMVSSVNQFGEARIIRISDIDPSLPALMWKILLFSTIIVFNLMLVNLLDHPYKGLLKIEPDAFTKILKHYKEEQK
jgi:hypothetical protein